MSRIAEIAGASATSARMKSQPLGRGGWGGYLKAICPAQLFLKLSYLGSLIASSSRHSKEVGLTSFPAADRPPVLIPFFTFRIMVGCSLLMLGLAWLGILFMASGTLERQRWFLWATLCSFPLGFIATLTGWFTAEVGRQPWAIYGQIRTADAVTPFLTPPQVAVSLVIFTVVYALIFIAGATYIYRLLQRGPVQLPSFDHATTNPKRRCR